MIERSTLVAGVDGCPAGWVAVIGSVGLTEPWLAVEADMAMLFRRYPRVMSWAVDIPIGLSDGGSRDCDRLARKRLDPKRGSSVFPAPPRAVVEAAQLGLADYREVCRLAAEATGKKISRQAWNITPKIAEVRRALIEKPQLANRVFETHPELGFARLAGGDQIVEAKKTPTGHLQRRQLLSREFGVDHVERLMDQTTATRGVAIDDTLDALVCWLAAQRATLGQDESVPADPVSDRTNLPLAIRW